MKPKSKQRSILEDVIIYLCFKVKPISLRKITKLVYLTDLYYYELYDRQLTNVEFLHHKHGAWAPEIYDAIEKLYDEGILDEQVVKTRDGYSAILPIPKVKETSISLPDENAFAVLESVVNDWGAAKPQVVVDYTKTTVPFLGTSYGEPIDFKRSDPIVEYAKKHKISTSEAATSFVLSSKKLTNSICRADAELRK